MEWTHSHRPLLDLPTCSRRWLYLPDPAPLCISLSFLSPLCSSALLFCQLYFPYLPLESAFFFSLSLFPFSLPPLHYFIDSLSLCWYVWLCFTDYMWTPSHSVAVRLLCKCDCARGATCTGVWRGERRGPQAHICKNRDKSCCVVFAASPRVKQ